MFYRNTTESKHLNVRVVSLAAGLALATAAVIGSSDLLQKGSTSETSPPVTPRVQRIESQFGTMPDAVYAVEGISVPQIAASSAEPANLGNNLGLGQPGERSTAQPQFTTMADADFASR